MNLSDQQGYWDFPFNRDKQETQVESATTACIYVHICVSMCLCQHGRQRVCYRNGVGMAVDATNGIQLCKTRQLCPHVNM